MPGLLPAKAENGRKRPSVVSFCGTKRQHADMNQWKDRCPPPVVSFCRTKMRHTEHAISGTSPEFCAGQSHPGLRKGGVLPGREVMPVLSRRGGTGVYARFRLQPVFGPAFMPGLWQAIIVPYSNSFPVVRPVYGPPFARQSVGGSPVNGADSANCQINTRDSGGCGLPGINAGPTTG
jgi:hypothetical protein